MRTSKRCPKCSHDQILLVEQVPELGKSDHVRPMHIATVAIGKNYVGDDKHGTAGALTATVCRACGYTELYVARPEELIVDGRYIREL